MTGGPLSEERRRALDVAIAERVMGATWVPAPSEYAGDREWLRLGGQIVAYRKLDGRLVPKADEYSTDIAAAFQVVDAMRARGWHYELRDTLSGDHKAAFGTGRVKGGQPFAAIAPTVAEAICNAALAALSPSTDEPETPHE